MLGEDTANIATFMLQVKRRRQRHNISATVLEHLMAIAELTHKHKERPRTPQIRKALGVTSNTMFRTINLSGLVDITKIEANNGQSKAYKITEEGEMILTAILNPASKKSCN